MSRVVEKILEALQFRAELTVDLLDSVLSDRKTFYRKTRRFYLQGPKEFKTDWAEWYRKRQSFYSLLNQLKRDGLIEKRGKQRNAIWHITSRGMDRLWHYTAPRERRPGGIPMRAYPKEKAPGVVIVAFDIPETQRKKRDWLRENLIALGLTLLQKSVWIGNTRMPQDFIKDLRMQGILPFVHIFSVDKQGTIKQAQHVY